MRISEGVRELNAQEITQEMADTTTTTSGISDVTSEVWRERIIEESRPMRRFTAVSEQYDDLVGSSDKTLKIPKSTKALDLSVTGTAEGATRTYKQMDQMANVQVDITPSSFRKGGIAISKEAVMTTNVNLIEEARRQTAEDLAQDLDLAIKSQLDTDVPATHKVDQTGSSRLTPDSISKAMQHIENDDFVPRWLVISPSMKHDLRTDSQFVNASEYGSDRVIQNGEIGEYLGLRVIESTNVGSDAYMVGQNRSGRNVGPVVVWKERPQVGQSYDPEDAEHRVFYDQAFEVTTLQADALAMIET